MEYTWERPGVRNLIRYFKDRFSELDICKVRLDKVRFTQIDMEDNKLLVKRLSEEEVKEAVWDCDGNKISRPDGFTSTSLKNSKML